MCEPTHSITQFPPYSDSGMPVDKAIGMAIEKKNKKLHKMIEWGKKIMGLFHYSKLGAGHSEGLGLGREISLLPPFTQYEALWWDRTIRRDGPHLITANTEAEALEAATYYAQNTSIGSLQSLRRFLDTSVRNSERPDLYIRQFINSMVVDKDKFISHLRHACQVKSLHDLRLGLSDQTKKHWFVDQVLKVMLGTTRKRSQLTCAWADDLSLWTPKKGCAPGQ